MPDTTEMCSPLLEFGCGMSGSCCGTAIATTLIHAITAVAKKGDNFILQFLISISKIIGGLQVDKLGYLGIALQPVLALIITLAH